MQETACKPDSNSNSPMQQPALRNLEMLVHSGQQNIKGNNYAEDVYGHVQPNYPLLLTRPAHENRSAIGLMSTTTALDVA